MSRERSSDRWRRFAREVSPQEVVEAPRFARRERRIEHVEKHLLRARHERWHRVFAPDLLAEAREEHRTAGWGPRCERIAADYEGLVAAILLERCREGAGHAHQLTVRDPGAEDLAGAVVEETVYAWDLETRILVIATRRIWDPRRTAGFAEAGSGNPSADVEIVPPPVVSAGRQGPYRLRTGYRFHADRPEAGFRREIRRKLNDLETFSLDRLPLWMVEHDRATATIAT